MTDLADKAQYLEELNLKRALSARKQVLPRTGKCLYCETSVPLTHRYCDSECRQFYEEEHANRKNSHS